MRRLVLTGMVALSIVGATAPALAQWAVFDSSNYAQALEQVKTLQQQYQTLQQQLQTAQQTYQSVTHLPENMLNELGQQFNTQQLRNVLPGSSSITNMLNGSTLSSAATSFLNQNRVYSPRGRTRERPKSIGAPTASPTIRPWRPTSIRRRRLTLPLYRALKGCSLPRRTQRRLPTFKREFRKNRRSCKRSKFRRNPF
jgi:type II secretory pathway pseudopilin PulG